MSATAPGSRGKVALITGASHGIGAGLVEGFRGAGYSVVGTARSIEASEDPDYLTVAGDITRTETAEHVFQQAIDRFGRSGRRCTTRPPTRASPRYTLSAAWARSATSSTAPCISSGRRS